jgi:hypothetical protein
MSNAWHGGQCIAAAATGRMVGSDSSNQGFAEVGPPGYVIRSSHRRRTSRASYQRSISVSYQDW